VAARVDLVARDSGTVVPIGESDLARPRSGDREDPVCHAAAGPDTSMAPNERFDNGAASGFEDAVSELLTPKAPNRQVDQGDCRCSGDDDRDHPVEVRSRGQRKGTRHVA